MSKVTRETADRWLEDSQATFATFKERREGYDNLVHMEWDATLDPRLGIDTATYTTPDLEEAEHDFADILTMNPTRFAGNPGEQGDHAKKAMEDGVLWSARTWAEENSGRWIDRKIAGGQARYGLKWMRMLHHPIEDPETEGMKDREEAMKNQPHPWYFEDVPDLSVSFLPKRENAEVIVAELEYPVLSAYDEYQVDGEKIGKEKGKQYRPYCESGKLGWLGDGDVADRSQWDKTLKLIVIEYRDYDHLCPVCPDKHPLWAGIEILKGGQQETKEGEVAQEYLLPYKHWPTLRLAQGRTTNDRDPHWHFRPLSFRLLVEATVMNWAISTLMTLSNRDSSDSRVYVSTAKLSDAAVGKVPEEFWDQMSVPLPDPGANEIPVIHGELLVWPTNMAEMLWEVYKDARQRFIEAKPNRFMTGENFEESQRGTGTANLQGLQQARLPFNWLLSQSDKFILEAKEDQLHAMRYWDYEAENETKFYVTLMGDESVKGMTPEAGKSVFMSASKAEYHWKLLLVTESETLQEALQNHQEAIMLHDKGWLDAEQTVERLGFYDTKQQLRKIRKYQLQKEMAPVKLTLQTAVLKTIMASVAEIDPVLLGIAQPVVEGQGQKGDPTGGQPPPPQPEITLPAVQGPTGGPSPVGVMG